MGKQFDVRRQRYKKNRILGMNAYNAARAAGYSEAYCHSIGHKLDKIHCPNLMEEFERAGLTNRAIVNIALEGLNATKEGDPDWGARHRFFETILKLTKKLEQAEKVTENTVKVYVVNNDADVQDREKREVIEADVVQGQTRISLEQQDEVSPT